MEKNWTNSTTIKIIWETKIRRNNKRRKYSNWIINNSKKNDILWKGISGITYKGSFLNGTKVAVKILSILDSKVFINEIKLLMKLRHPNCVRLIGYTTAPNHMIVMELYPTNLHKLLNENTIELKLKKSLSLDVISGLVYLHFSSIIHRDLKTQNILITKDYTACITDFGVSKSINTVSNNSLRVVGTPTYMAPEICSLLLSDITYTIKSDYYSLGIILWEIFENNPLPYFKEYPQIYSAFSSLAIAPFIHQNKIRPVFEELNNNQLLFKDLKEQISQLWSEEPNQRPNELTTITQIIERLP